MGKRRVGKGMLGILPPGLLTPTVPYCSIQSIHKELYVTRIELKRSDVQNSMRLRTILFEIREILKKKPKEMD